MEVSMRMSMTAFARADGEFKGQVFSVEIKTVNHRFLEIAPRLPERLRLLDSALREKCQETFYRGKIDCWVNFHSDHGEKNLVLNTQQLNRWLLIFSDSGAFQSLGKPDWATMLSLPGVMQESLDDDAGLSAAILETFDQALAQVLAMRAREGELIEGTLHEQLNKLEAQVLAIEERVPMISTTLTQQIQEKIATLQLEVDPQRFEQELFFLISKMDIKEEIDRLHFHIDQARNTLADDGAVGRRMDFLMQEFNREANTLGAKVYDNQLSAAAVDLKVIIEQMREQVQNLE
ncbi:YicC family protein [Dichelobacter nodosus]|nr:YicC family protein [Dichelobacter nodosus]